MKAFRTVLFLSLIAGAGIARADYPQAPSGWKEASRSNEQVVFYREDEQVKAREFQVVGDIDAPPSAVFGVVTDVENHPKFMPFTQLSHIVQRVSPDEIVCYQVIAQPMVSQRDFYLHIKRTPGTSPDSVWRSEWYAVPEFGPENPGKVRIKVSQGSWQFEPIDGGRRTRLTYTSVTNIGGSIPRWMADMSSSSVLAKMYDSIRKRVAAR